VGAVISNSRCVDPQEPLGRFTALPLLLAVSRCYCSLFLAVISLCCRQKLEGFHGERRPPGCSSGVLSAISAVRLSKRSSSAARSRGMCSPGFNLLYDVEAQMEDRGTVGIPAAGN